jgi:hypothetical protein
MTNTKMLWDSPEYVAEITRFKRLMGLQTFRQAEEALWPIRARKRHLKVLERRDLEATTIKTKH